MGETEKQCSGCHQVYPATVEYFHRRSGRKSGLQSICKQCRKKLDHERYLSPEYQARLRERSQTEQYKEYHRNYEQTEKAKATRKSYRETPRAKALKQESNRRRNLRDDVKVRKRELATRPDVQERKRSRSRERYERMREQQLAYFRIHNQKPESKLKATARRHKRRALERNAPGFYTDTDIVELYDLQDGRCGYCGIPLNNKFHVDHIEPLSRGGSNELNNIILACPHCNWSKNDKPLKEWEQYLYGN